MRRGVLWTIDRKILRLSGAYLDSQLLLDSYSQAEGPYRCLRRGRGLARRSSRGLTLSHVFTYDITTHTHMIATSAENAGRHHGQHTADSV